MSGEKVKPDITVKGNQSVLTMWISEDKLRVSISKRSDQGFERLDSYSIPLDYLMFKVFEKNRRMIKRFSELVETIEEEES